MKDGLTLQLCADLFSRRVIGWALAARQDEALVEMALRMALLHRRPGAGFLFHSDRGSQSTSDRYLSLLAQAQITGSMSRTGDCYDNAVPESFFGTLKTECVEDSSFESRAQARQVIFECTECYSNRLGRHSSPGYKSPVISEQLMC